MTTTIPPLRGTIIPCDYIHRDALSGKYTILGTHTDYFNANGSDDILLPKGLWMYVRIQSETTGTFHGSLSIINRNSSPTEAPIQRFIIPITIDDPLTPFEAAIQIPPFTARPQIPPSPRKPSRSTCTMWLEINNQSIASSPLRFTFYHPDDYHAHHQSR